MAATNRSKDDLINESTGLYKDNTNREISASDLRDGIYSVFQPQLFCQGRLTLETGVAISTSDQTAKTSVYFTPFGGNIVALFDGTSWKLFTFTELTLALGTITSGKNYDVFLYDNAGTLTLELSAAWTNDTTRADALTTQDGVYVKSGATTRRYIGTIRTTSTTTTEDSSVKRFVWNAYNRVPRHMERKETADSWTYSTETWRQSNANTANQLELVCGIAGETISVAVIALSANTAGATARRTAIGVNSTTTPSGLMAQNQTAANLTVTATLINEFVPALGYSFFAWLEQCIASGTTTWYGDAGAPTQHQNGMNGVWPC